MSGLLKGGGYAAGMAPELVQKRMAELNTGFDGTAKFTGADRTAQGLAYAVVNGQERVYLLQRVAGETMQADERHRIVEFALRADGGISEPIAWSEELSIGHQCLTAIQQGADLYLYAQMTTDPAQTGSKAGKGYSKIKWRGALTSQADVTSRQVWGWNGSGHRFAAYCGATVAVSTDGRYLILVGSDITGDDLEDAANCMMVYDRAALEAAPDPLAVDPLYSAKIKPPDFQRTQYNQGLACDGRNVYIVRGYAPALLQHVIQVFDLAGNLLREVSIDDVRGHYGKDGLLNHPTLGTPQSMEPEGLALRGDELLILSIDFWRANSPIVSYGGRNWASTASNNIGTPPEKDLFWVETTKAATAGAWDAATTYGYGTGWTQKSKVIYSIRAPKGETGEQPISRAVTRRPSGASMVSRPNQVDVAFKWGDVFQVAAYAENTEQYSRALEIAGQQFLRLFDQRAGSDNTKYVYVGAQFGGGREIMEIRARDSGLGNGAGINLYGKGDSASAGKLIFSSYDTGNSTNKEWHVQGNGTLRVGVDLGQDIGTAALRTKNVFSSQFRPGDGTVMLTSCTGTPENQITAAVGSLCMRQDGGAGTRLYWKNTGAGNTGWVAIL